MQSLFAALADHARRQPGALALAGSRARVHYGELLPQVRALAGIIRAQRVGLALDNGPAWVLADLALLLKGAVCVPVPGFFSPGQVEHLVADAGLQALLTDQPRRYLERYPALRAEPITLAGEDLYWLYWPEADGVPGVPPGTAKVTYTSGTTGQPKGVCLAASTLLRVSTSLCQASSAASDDRALSLLPLATLLENIAGVYVPLLAGGQCTLPSLEETGMAGAAGIDASVLLRALRQCLPTGLVLVPQLLQVLVEAAETGVPLPATLRFVAVGGAPVSLQLLERAARLGIPVYEGYGLSEAGSVVCLNTPEASRPGSVGRPLPHACLRLADDGEILLGGDRFSGYLGDTVPARPAWHATGDLGYQDGDGFIYLTGRSQHRFCTAYGRNVAPEWVERELLAGGAIAQCAVFGEARAFNTAVIVPRPGATVEQVQADLDSANARLPDYARVSRFTLAGAPFSTANGQLTGTCRPRRERIAEEYQQAIAALYQEVGA